MPRAPRKKHPMGRPQVPIEWDKVDLMLEAGCNGVECAAYYGIHQNTFYERCMMEKGVTFSEYLAEKRSRGDNLLRAKQYQHAMKGNTTMMVWLGKNRLGQRDTPKEIDVSKESLDAFTAIMEQLKESQDH